ncbi:MAG: prephenate dehydratase [Candidatus Acidiferrales bacterium]
MTTTASQSDKPRVAFQGERGAFSEEAIVKLLGESVRLVPRPTFEALFAAIPDGAADLVLAPLENSLAGSVHQSYDLLLESSLHIIGEVTIPIVHNLIGCPGASLGALRVVQSHPVALAQCLRFFVEHPDIQRVASTDTAGSVREITERGDKSVAAIAGRRAAELYGGVILLEHLEDHRENYTRFALLSTTPGAAAEGNKLSLVVKVNHTPGALYAALGAFANRGINLLKIESRPLKGSPWHYSFYLDLEGSTADPKVQAALEELRAHAYESRLLGCYPSAAGAAENAKGAGRASSTERR